MGIQNETVRRYAGHERSLIAYGNIFAKELMDEEIGKLAKVDIPDSLGIVAEHESGATAVYHLSNVAHLGFQSFGFFGTKASLKYEGTGAFIAPRGAHNWEPLEIDPSSLGRWRVEEDFIEAIREGKPVTHTSFSDGVKYMEFTEAVQISMAEERRVYLPLD